jgi:predicted ATPase
MRICQLEIEGFKSLKHVTWEPGPLNVIIGPNGAGKSNLLRFLQFIRAAAEGKLAKSVQSMGGFRALLWDGTAPRLRFKLTGPNVKAGPEEYSLEVMLVGETAYHITSELLANYAAVRAGTGQHPTKLVERSLRRAEVYSEKNGHVTVYGVPEDEVFLSTLGGPVSPSKWLPSFIDYLRSLAVYHDVAVDQGAPMRRPAVASLDDTVDPGGQNLIAVLHTLYATDPEFERHVDLAMSSAFGPDYEKLVFPPAADQHVQLRVRWKTLRRPQSTADLSDGTLRFLFLLAVLASPKPPPLIAIDEPETGLHPSMLPIVAELAVDASRRTQVILTTHSPEFLHAFRETKPAVTVAQWMEGETRLRRLEGESLDYWLSKYSLGELFKLGELEDLE